MSEAFVRGGSPDTCQHTLDDVADGSLPRGVGGRAGFEVWGPSAGMGHSVEIGRKHLAERWASRNPKGPPKIHGLSLHLRSKPKPGKWLTQSLAADDAKWMVLERQEAQQSQTQHGSRRQTMRRANKGSGMARGASPRNSQTLGGAWIRRSPPSENEGNDTFTRMHRK